MNLDDRARRAAAQLNAEVDRRPFAHAVPPVRPRAGWRVAVAACCVLAVSAVGVLVARGLNRDGARTVTAADRPGQTTDAPPAPTPTTTSATGTGGVPAEWTRCTDADHGFSVGYPGGWHTAPEPPPEAKEDFLAMGPCRFIDPQRFEIRYGTDGPTTALAVFHDEGPYDEVSKNNEDPSDHERVLLREPATVQGRRAVRVERSIGKEFYGARYYGWIIDRGGQAFTVGGFWSPQSTLTYSEWKAVVDRAVESLRFPR